MISWLTTKSIAPAANASPQGQRLRHPEDPGAECAAERSASPVAAAIATAEIRIAAEPTAAPGV